MKTLTLFFFFVFTCSLTSNAQITKGHWMVGGDANFNFSKTKNTSSNGFVATNKVANFRITPDIGYLLYDKFTIGLSPFLAFSNPEGANNNSTSYGIGPFVRYYFLKTDNIINLFAHTGYFYAHTKNPSDNGNSSSFELKAGPVIYFNSSVGLELTLGYKKDNLNTSSGSKGEFNTLSFNIGFQIHLEK
ncbi:hypothetical protein RBH94_06710 [Aestuariibaculum sp. YM273]|uniref:hypothetical protein n=1 Tax=Aestuariibaculum sp. YM273 TaxID=3070659 RepID=UPI0027DE318B|nr:hypothetical protein [Aestuariibaculum sp. YM273]WMI66849.1 hypothetical protein RBH94_06710 [Aestuariibaculum sp. YM273]